MQGLVVSEHLTQTLKLNVEEEGGHVTDRVSLSPGQALENIERSWGNVLNSSRGVSSALPASEIVVTPTVWSLHRREAAG